RGSNGCRVGESILGTGMSQNLSRGSDTLGFAHSAFLIQQSDDHGAALLAGKPGFLCHAKCCASCRLAVFHRNGALFL
ncbi:MAG: hypothetical protein AB2813_08940, partial [Candidatus Sedimenticola endophacoides]